MQILIAMEYIMILMIVIIQQERLKENACHIHMQLKIAYKTVQVIGEEHHG